MVNQTFSFSFAFTYIHLLLRLFNFLASPVKKITGTPRFIFYCVTKTKKTGWKGLQCPFPENKCRSCDTEDGGKAEYFS
jgi:hypothetical protein